MKRPLIRPRVARAVGRWGRGSGPVTFKEGFMSDASGRPAFSARLYTEVRQLIDVLDEYKPDPARAQEVGCGYGRLTPWIAEYADETYGIDPNETMVEVASELHPHIDFACITLQELDIPDVYFDLVVSWTVLQHIPPDDIGAACSQLARQLGSGGILVACEKTSGEGGKRCWARPVGKYDELLSPLQRVDSQQRRIELTDGREDIGEILIYEKP